ncbi:unnamed protein product, partial [Didymodactylos carnosus]
EYLIISPELVEQENDYVVLDWNEEIQYATIRNERWYK